MSPGSIDAQALLTQMRALAEQARGAEVRAREAAPGQADFGNALKQALEFVNTNQQEAAGLAKRFEQGEKGVELAEVMVAIQKANVSFQAATQVRNRLVSAYQDIMNMPL